MRTLGVDRTGLFLLFLFPLPSKNEDKTKATDDLSDIDRETERKTNKIPYCQLLLPGQYFCHPPQIDEETQQPVGCINNTAQVGCYPSPRLSCCQDDPPRQPSGAGDRAASRSSDGRSHPPPPPSRPFVPLSDCKSVFTQKSQAQAQPQVSELLLDEELDVHPQSSTNYSTAFNRNIPCDSTDGHHFETALLLSVFLGMFGVDRFYLGYPAIGIIKFSTLGFFFIGWLVDVILIAAQVVGPASGKGYVIDMFGARLKRLQVNELTYFYANYDEF